MLGWSKATILMSGASVMALAAAGAVAYRIATTVPVSTSADLPPAGQIAAPPPAPARGQGPGAVASKPQGAPASGSDSPARMASTGPADVTANVGASATPRVPATGPPPSATVPLVPPASSSSAPAAPAPAAPQPQSAAGTPSFDIVRVEPNGETVVAGRSLPGAKVRLVDRGRVVGEALADNGGQFVILPSALEPGDHELTLLTTPTSGRDLVSDQTVTVAVSRNPHEPVLVALAAPGKPTQVLAGATSGPAPTLPGDKTPVFVRTAEAAGDGHFIATGTAAPGANLRLYLNGADVATVTANKDGKWSLTVSKGLSPGSYKVRADQVDSKGTVVARAEVPFDFAPLAAGSGDRPVTVTAAEAPGGAAAVVDELKTVKVARGDSLWRISRVVFGRGSLYTQIYEANAKQIRDQSLIYPGQVFVVPRG